MYDSSGFRKTVEGKYHLIGRIRRVFRTRRRKQKRELCTSLFEPFWFVPCMSKYDIAN